MCSTSPEAYSLALKLCDEYKQRKQKEKELNKRKEETKKRTEAAEKQGPSRTITQINYGKHEQTVKELDRQEKEEEYARKKNEAAQWCTLDHEHGPNCRRPVGGCSHDHQKEWAIYEKSTEEKIAAADRFRQEGNEAYRKQNYGLAAVHYRKALLQFDYTFADTEEEETAVENVKVPCLLNLAACKCQQEEWDEVLTQCRLALEINPRSVKAFYRTAQAHLARDQFELAKDALTSAIEIEPHNAEVRALYGQLKKNMANYKARRKEVFKEMMSGGAEAGAGEGAGEGAADEEEEASRRPVPEEGAGAARADEQAGARATDGRSDEAAAAPAEEAAGAARQEQGASAGAQDREEPGVLLGQAPREAEPATLRRRRGEREPAAGAGHEAEELVGDDAQEEDDPVVLPPKVLNGILIFAVLLGIVCLLVGILAYSYGAQSNSDPG